MSDDILRSVDFRNKINTQSLEILRDLGDGDRLVLEIILQMQKNDALHLEILRSLSEGPQRLEQSVSDEVEVEVEVESSSSLSGSLDELEDVAEGEYEAPFLEQLSAIVESLDGMLEDDVYESIKESVSTFPGEWVHKLHDSLGQPEVARKLALLCADHIQALEGGSEKSAIVDCVNKIGDTERALELIAELRSSWSGHESQQDLLNLFSLASGMSDADDRNLMSAGDLREFGQDILNRFDDLDAVLSVFGSVAIDTEDEDWALQIAQAIQIRLADIKEFEPHETFFRALSSSKMELLAPAESQFRQRLVERLLDRFFEEDEAAPAYHFIVGEREDITKFDISPTQVTDMFDIALGQIDQADIGFRRDLGELVGEIREVARLDGQWCDAFIERIYDQMVNNLQEHAPDGYFNDVLNFCRNQLGDDHRAAQLFHRFEGEMRAEAEEYGYDDGFDWLDELSDDPQVVEEGSPDQSSNSAKLKEDSYASEVSESYRLYIKTEPAGEIRCSVISGKDTVAFARRLMARDVSQPELEEIAQEASVFDLYGVFGPGGETDFDREPNYIFEPKACLPGTEADGVKLYEPAIYVVQSLLTKGSIEHDISGLDKSNVEELNLTYRKFELPVEHPTYGDLEGAVLTNIEFEGTSYDPREELVDREYEERVIHVIGTYGEVANNFATFINNERVEGDGWDDIMLIEHFLHQEKELADESAELVKELRTRWSGEGFGEELNNLFGFICSSLSDTEHGFMTPDALQEFGEDILTRFDDMYIMQSVFDSVASRTEDEDWASAIADTLITNLSGVRDFDQHANLLHSLANSSMEALAPVRGEFAQTLVQRTLEDFFENTGEDISNGLRWQMENIAAQDSVSAEQLSRTFETALSGALEEDIGSRSDIGRMAFEQKNEGRLDRDWVDGFVTRVFDEMVGILEEHAPENYFYDVVDYCREVLGDDEKAGRVFYRFEDEMRAQAEEEDRDLDWLDGLAD